MSVYVVLLPVLLVAAGYLYHLYPQIFHIDLNSDMAPSYKLVYFDSRGRAEPTRWVFAYAGVNYEDYRIKKEDWATLKPNAPFGQLPYLEVDGKALPQSLTIARYAARQNGLGGKDDWEAAQADAIVDYVQG